MASIMHFFFFLLLLPALLVQSQQEGEEICVEGFIMDKFCVDMGTLLDKPQLASLEFPGEHSLHCLVDVKECYESTFLILSEPQNGSSMYTVAYQVDDDGRETLITLARSVGLAGKYPACSTCTNEADSGLLQGFRAEVYGFVSDSSSTPPTLRVTSAFVSNGRLASDICTLQLATNTPTNSPATRPPQTIQTPSSRSPVAIPTTPTTPPPTLRPIISTSTPIRNIPMPTIAESPTSYPYNNGTIAPITTSVPTQNASTAPSFTPIMDVSNNGTIAPITAGIPTQNDSTTPSLTPVMDVPIRNVTMNPPLVPSNTPLIVSGERPTNNLTPSPVSSNVTSAAYTKDAFIAMRNALHIAFTVSVIFYSFDIYR